MTRIEPVTMRSLLLAVLLASCGGTSSSNGSTNGSTVHANAASDGPTVAWNEWDAPAFERARRENRPIMLSVQAGWCHWCHVMNNTTYRDEEVLRTLEDGFVSIRADSDARPDLAERYQAYGWPATVFLRPDGAQILALRGYHNPETFREVLANVRAAHAEGRSLDEEVGASTPPPEDLDEMRRQLVAQLDSMYDEEAQGWGRRQRYPLAAPVEHAFFRAAVRGETDWRDRAQRSLENYARLIDPVFGGMYQYSVPSAWDRPHFEKIVPVQAGAMSAFSEAYRATGNEIWLQHAVEIQRYVSEFLRSESGAFYVSQDADLGGHGQPGPHIAGADYYALDDAGRRELGLPRVDSHIYAATNGRLIVGHTALAVASGRRAPLAQAVAAAETIQRTHRSDSGLFVHDADADDPLFYLADQAHMLAGFVALHQATAQARWKAAATELVRAMEPLRDEARGGYVAHTADPRADGFFDEARIPIADNAVAARAILTLSRLSHEDEESEALEAIAIAALRACARPDELASMGRMIGEYVMALEALNATYVVLSVVGPETTTTDALHRAAVSFYEPTRLVELGRPGESRYPFPGQPAVFLCSGEACSMPVTEPAELAPNALAFLGR